MKKNKLKTIIHTDPFVGDLTLLDLCYFLQNTAMRQNELQLNLEKYVESLGFDKNAVSNMFEKSNIANSLEMLDKIIRDDL